MSYLVTARKWRPQTFDQVVGQEHISKTLKNAIVNNRIAHAYIFAGPRGVGKTTTARIFAKTLNCLNPKDGEPCNKCEMCNSFNKSQSLDVIEIDGASNRRIEEIRQLRESVKYAPTKGSYKVYIIDEVHMLTTESFNALLKTLEEPPEQTIFIFATTDVHKVPLTIISRCQRFDFRRIEMNAIKETLAKIAEAEKIKIDDKSLTIVSKKADGALRDAESLFDQLVSFCGTDIKADEVASMLNLINEDLYFEVSDAILAKDFKEAFRISQLIYDNGWNFIDFMNGLVEHFRNIMTVVIRKDTSLIETAKSYQEKYSRYADSFSEGDVLRILNYLNRTQYELKSAQNQKLKIEVTLCHIIGLEKTSTISELVQKLSNGNTGISKKKVINNQTDNKENQKPLKETTTAQPEPEIQLPEKKVQPSSKFESVANNWKNFVDVVGNEKFTLAGHLINSEPMKLDGNLLKVKLASQEDVEIIKGNESFLDCLKKNADEVFNKRLKFEFTSMSKAPTPNESKEKSISNVDSNLSSTESSIVNAIIKELGGREITN